MQIHKPTAPEEIGRCFARIIANSKSAERLWVERREDCVDIWLLTAPTSADGERELYGRGLALYDQFPNDSIRLHVVNPPLFGGGGGGGWPGHRVVGGLAPPEFSLESAMIPVDATEIPLKHK